MDESEGWITECQDAEDGTGDLIVTLPPNFIAQTGLEIGDELNIEVVNGAIVITRKIQCVLGHLMLASEGYCPAAYVETDEVCTEELVRLQQLQRSKGSSPGAARHYQRKCVRH
ncbi:AbrB/MazE/SpoVT family DNA-binding domain-containing protein [Pseudomonas simiae]|uniref:AbrB/MazE/SpoVT family DNA-binding domain-containing protein n=1 Tax=Pseudomonas simiae TaxID=321846 RepID=UPI00405A1CBC